MTSSNNSLEKTKNNTNNREYYEYLGGIPSYIPLTYIKPLFPGLLANIKIYLKIQNVPNIFNKMTLEITLIILPGISEATTWTLNPKRTNVPLIASGLCKHTYYKAIKF